MLVKTKMIGEGYLRWHHNSRGEWHCGERAILPLIRLSRVRFLNYDLRSLKKSGEGAGKNFFFYHLIVPFEGHFLRKKTFDLDERKG